MKSFIFLFFILTIIACGKDGEDGISRFEGGVSMALNGVDGISTGVDFSDIEPGLACINGGVSIFTFRDINSDGLLQSEEQIIKVKSICHGQNGTNGIDSSVTLESISSSLGCPIGGVRISSSSSTPVEICNGLNGEQGIQGISGTNVIPVKFCPKDESDFPEYGLLIGKELFAVYWGTTPASPREEQAFLTKLESGKYQSTGGDNCLFNIE